MHLWEVTWVCLSTDIPHCTTVIYKFGELYFYCKKKTFNKYPKYTDYKTELSICSKKKVNFLSSPAYCSSHPGCT